MKVAQGDHETADKLQDAAEHAYLDFFNAGMQDATCAATILIYNAFIRSRETEERAAKFFKFVSDHTFYDDSPPATGDRLAFIFTNGGFLGHSEALRTVLSYSNEKPYIVSLGKIHPDFVEAFKDYEIIDARTPRADGGHASRLAWLKPELKRLGVGSSVWVSTLPVSHHGFGMNLTAKKTFWALRFHAFFGDAQLITSNAPRGTAEVTYHGRTWKGFPIPWPRPYPKEPCELRDKLKGFIYGVIGREEKIAHPDYLGMLVELLKRAPDAHLIYTGRNTHAATEKAFRDAGIASRCHFVGWVKPWIMQDFDCYLETFPLGGICSVYAAQYGVPVVSLAGAASPMALRGPTAASIEEYIQQALAVKDGSYRPDMGGLCEREMALAEEDVKQFWEWVNPSSE